MLIKTIRINPPKQPYIDWAGVLIPLAIICAAASAFAGEPASRCLDLRTLTISNATIDQVQLVPPGGLGQQPGYTGLPAFCRVAIKSRPVPDSEIRIEVWLPEHGWNKRLQAVGDGGLAGAIPTPLMAEALAGGYAVAGTDTGHVGGNADFMPGHPEKLVDFAYRSTHEMAVAAKAVVASFYGEAPRKSYYNACSGGGRHGITSAQLYPRDFDGIVAGAPSWNQARLDAARIGINLTVNRNPEGRIPPAKYAMVHRAVLEACDAQDGIKDGLLENPSRCAFDYATLQCKGADAPDCLTAAQVQSAKLLTSSFRDPASGKVLLEPHLWPGSELQWATLAGPEPLPNSVARVRRFHLRDPEYDFRFENIAADVERAAEMDAGLLASNNFNLAPFFASGGKLILWHGWADPQVPAQNSVIYHEKVRQAVGEAADGSMALFMLPGVLHCRGGVGPDEFDKMGPITAWVEEGRRPVRLIASKRVDGKVQRTRPLCPYPQVARHDGRGNPDRAESFACVDVKR